MFGWLRTHVGLGQVRRRLDVVEDDVAHLFKMLQKKRGRETGGIRHENQPEPDAALDPRIPADLDPISRRIWERRLKKGTG